MYRPQTYALYVKAPGSEPECAWNGTWWQCHEWMLNLRMSAKPGTEYEIVEEDL